MESKQEAGAAVFYVDLSVFPVSDLTDSLHPNDTGYQLLANQWLTAIELDTPALNQPVSCGSIPAGCSDPAVLAGSSPGGISTGGHTPGPVGPEPEAAPQTSLNQIASGVGAPAGSKVLFSDINGDGRADYVVVNPTTGSLTVWLNGGPKRVGPGRLVMVPPGYDCFRRCSRGNHPVWRHQWGWLSGLPDRQSENRGRTGVPEWGPNASAPGGWAWYPKGTIATGVSAPPGSHVVFADINNDGYADYLSISSVNGQVSAWLNGGQNASAANGWVLTPLGQVSPGAGAPTSKLQISEADINGDGKADLLALTRSTGAIYAWLNEGLDTGFTGNWVPEYNLIGVGLPSGIPSFADLNGDGLADFVLVAPNSSISGTLINKGLGGDGPTGVTLSLGG